MEEMNREIVKEGFKEALKEDKKNKVEEVKKAILQTLEKLLTKEKLFKELQEEIKILRLDIKDFKEGRLDRIEERQKLSPKAKQTSVVLIEKEIVKEPIVKEIHHWYEPYRLTWSYPMISVPNWSVPIATYDTTSLVTFSSATINCSIAKDATCGTYQLSTGEVKLV